MKIKRKNVDLKKRKYYRKTELFQRMVKNFILYNQNVFFHLVLKNNCKLRYHKQSYKTGIKNYCIFSGRSRGVYK